MSKNDGGGVGGLKRSECEIIEQGGGGCMQRAGHAGGQGSGVCGEVGQRGT